MRSPLAKRLAEAMKGPPEVKGVELAVACKVKPASVSGWLSGKSKSMEASNLLAAARRLKVDPDWLATGVGEMRPKTNAAGENIVVYDWGAQSTWPFVNISRSEFAALSQIELARVEGFIQGLLAAGQQGLKSNGPGG